MKYTINMCQFGLVENIYCYITNEGEFIEIDDYH